MASCFISISKSSKRATVLWRLSKACFPYPIERVLSDNGSIHEEFVAYHEDLLFTDVNLFNENLLDCLAWFNTGRPQLWTWVNITLRVLED